MKANKKLVYPKFFAVKGVEGDLCVSITFLLVPAFTSFTVACIENVYLNNIYCLFECLLCPKSDSTLVTGESAAKYTPTNYK